MTPLRERPGGFLSAAEPSALLAAAGTPLPVAWAWAVPGFCGRLKRTRRLRTGLARTLYRFALIGSGGAAEALGGLPAGCLPGAAIAFVVFRGFTLQVVPVGPLALRQGGPRR